MVLVTPPSQLFRSSSDMLMSHSDALLVFLDPLLQGLVVGCCLSGPKQEINWQPGVMTKHQIVWSMSSSLMGCGVIGKGKLRKMLWPASLLLHRQCAQEVVHGTVEPFTLSITLWVIRRGSTLLNPIHLAQLLDQQALKESALIGVYTGRGPKPMEPLLHQCLGHRWCPLVLSGDGL